MDLHRLRGAWRAASPHILPRHRRALGHPRSPSSAIEGWSLDDSVWHLRKQLAREFLRAANIPGDLERQLRKFGPQYGGRSPAQLLRVALHWHGIRFLTVAGLTHGHAKWAARHGDESFSTLEVGTNIGLMSIAIKERLPVADVVGCDRQTKSIDLAKIYEQVLDKRGVEWAIVDGRSLDQQFGARLFNVVYLCEILEHYALSEPEGRAVQSALLEQACAVCKPGGWVFVSVPFEDRIPIKSHLTDFTAETLTSLIAPYASKIVWFADERLRFHLDNHFLLTFQPK